MHMLTAQHRVAPRWVRSPAALQTSSKSTCTCSRQLVQTQATRQDNPLVVGLVSALTESLRLLGVGKERYREVAAVAPKKVTRLWRGDISGVMREIKRDFNQNQYIISGIISDKIYDPDCLFADPTISFRGLELWKRNLQLLTPFLVQPSLEILSIKRLGKSPEGNAEVLKSTWRLRTYLNLPWKPLIDILGATEYTLNEDRNMVVKHVEEWNVSGAEALLQILRPSKVQKAILE